MKTRNALFMTALLLTLLYMGSGAAVEEQHLCKGASGKGWALLAGTGEALFKGKGLAIIIGEDPHIETDGKGTVRRITREVTAYQGNGQITVKGRKIALYVKGRGTLSRCGEGFEMISGKGLI